MTPCGVASVWRSFSGSRCECGERAGRVDRCTTGNTVSAGDGLLVGGQPEAILAASSTLHEVAFRTDDVAVGLARALGPAATTAAAAMPFAPIQALAVRQALEAVLAAPGSGLGSVAVAYEAASAQLRFTGQALEAAGAATAMATGGVLLLRGEQPEVLSSADGVDVRREAMSGGLSGGPVGATDTLGVRVVERPDGTTFYVVEVSVAAKAAASMGVQVNGVGGFAEAAEGVETTMRWAVPTRADAQMVLAAAGVGLLPTLALGALPPPTEATVAGVVTATGVATPLSPVASASGGIGLRNETTVLAGGGSRLGLTFSGSGQAALLGLAGAGGAASLRIAMDRNRAGTLTRLSLATTEEVDRGRHGLPMVESLNREATLVERTWELELDPEVRARAERIAAAIGRGEAPDGADVRGLTHVISGLGYDERVYDVRHQQLSADVSIPGIGVGGAVGVDTATLRTP